MKNLLISKGYLPWRIELYLFLCYSCQTCIGLSKISCTIERLGMKNRVLFLKSSVNQLYFEPFQRQVQTCFLESWCWYDQLYISLFEFFNLNFFNTLFSLFASFESFVLRMLLAVIDWQFFVFNNCECICSIFPCVWAFKN